MDQTREMDPNDTVDESKENNNYCKDTVSVYTRNAEKSCITHKVETKMRKQQLQNDLALTDKNISSLKIRISTARKLDVETGEKLYKATERDKHIRQRFDKTDKVLVVVTDEIVKQKNALKTQFQQRLDLDKELAEIQDKMQYIIRAKTKQAQIEENIEKDMVAFENLTVDDNLAKEVADLKAKKATLLKGKEQKRKNKLESKALLKELLEKTKRILELQKEQQALEMQLKEEQEYLKNNSGPIESSNDELLKRKDEIVIRKNTLEDAVREVEKSQVLLKENIQNIKEANQHQRNEIEKVKANIEYAKTSYQNETIRIKEEIQRESEKLIMEKDILKTASERIELFRQHIKESAEELDIQRNNLIAKDDEENIKYKQQLDEMKTKLEMFSKMSDDLDAEAMKKQEIANILVTDTKALRKKIEDDHIQAIADLKKNISIEDQKLKMAEALLNDRDKSMDTLHQQILDAEKRCEFEESRYRKRYALSKSLEEKIEKAKNDLTNFNKFYNMKQEDIDKQMKPNQIKKENLNITLYKQNQPDDTTAKNEEVQMNGVKRKNQSEKREMAKIKRRQSSEKLSDVATPPKVIVMDSDVEIIEAETSKTYPTGILKSPGKNNQPLQPRKIIKRRVTFEGIPESPVEKENEEPKSQTSLQSEISQSSVEDVVRDWIDDVAPTTSPGNRNKKRQFD